MGVERGQMLSHYRILAKLGEGGMGEVYRARDENLDRDVAIKILPSGTLTDDQTRKRFRKEAKTLSQLNHPHIATVHDFATEDGVDFLVMEYVEGMTLAAKLLGGVLPVDDVLCMGSEIADALEDAHERGIVHRDLKPGNIGLTLKGHVKVLDFGLAKVLGPLPDTATTESLTGGLAIAGTLPYMAPEQLRGGTVDHRSDLYALGAVLYEMATGRRAFAHGAAPVLIENILHGVPEAPSRLRPEIPPGLERVILKCLEKVPELRYQTARELLVDLRRMSTPSLSAERTRGPRKRLARPLLATGGLGVLLVGLAAILLSLNVHGWRDRLLGGFREESGAPRVPSAQKTGVASIAVLPFVDMSAEKDQEYFSDGMAEELINGLAQIPGLRVTGRTSAFSFKGKNEDLRVIGQKLNVGAILEGSVRKAGNRVRITAQLVNAADGFHLWSEAYDRTLDDIFAVQEDIARSVTGALRVALAVEPGTGLRSRGGSDNVKAYNAYLQAEYFFKRANWSKGDLEKALGYYEQALALDPGYALAWAGLGLIKSVMAGFGTLPVEEGSRQAREALERALALDANLAEAHGGLATIKMMHDWDWAGMEAEYQRAIDLAPGNANLLGGAATAFGVVGRFEESVALFRRALEVDPLSAGNWVLLGCTLLNAGRLEEAEAALKKGVELNPGYAGAFSFLGRVYLSEGRPAAALVEVQRETQPVWRLQGLALVHHALGRKKEADAALAELVERFQNDWAVQIAEAYAFRGETDRAFEWLERAFVQHEPGLPWVKTSSSFKSLQSDPRYAAFLERLGLPL